MWLKILLLVVTALVVAVIALLVYGNLRWNAETRAIRTRLDQAKTPQRVKHYDPKELDGLPAPVQRYFLATLTAGQPMIVALDIEQVGTMNMSETAEKWSAFTATQRVVTERAGFDWNAAITLFPGVTVRVHDAYVAGKGTLHAAILGTITVADIRGTPDAALGEFVRFVSEAAWYPTRMLPSQGAIWAAVDDTSALLTMTDGTLKVTLLIRFGSDNLISGFRAESRGRIVGRTTTVAPWQGRLWDYATVEGMRIPQQGEVEWVLPKVTKPYWRGRATRLRYAFD